MSQTVAQPERADDADSGSCPAELLTGLTVALAIDDAAWLEQGLGDLESLVLRCLRVAARHVSLPLDLVTELGATFSDDASVKRLNAEWRGIDKPTNVLSFPLIDLEPGDVPGPMLGDVVLARETLLREAAAEGKSLHDHLCHLIVHGFLHCLGFDHIDADEADEMETLETQILADLGIADPYAPDSPATSAAPEAVDTNELTQRR